MSVINQYGGRVSAFARAVVLKRAAIVFAAGVGAHLLVVYGILPDTAGPVVVDRVGQTIDFIAAVIGVFVIQAGVTPADPALAPRSADGRALVVTGQ